MSPLEGLAGQAQWAGRNVAYNLDFVPDDKLNWKPAPTSKSALEIVHEVVTVFTAMKPVLSGGAWAPPSLPPLTDRAMAKTQVVNAANAYADALRGVTVADLERKVDLPWGAISLKECAGFPVVDIIHHHGQIAYLQTMWGDTESHFFGM